MNINTHLKEKLVNRPWVEACLAGEIGQFPYRIASKGKASLGASNLLMQDRSVQVPKVIDGKTSYLINIPCSAKMLKMAPDFLLFLEKLFVEQSCESKENSKAFAKNRIGIVVGVNQPQSIDPSKNRELETLFGTLTKIKHVSLSAFGFFWIPKWESCVPSIPLLYKKETSYLLMKALSQNIATQILKLREGPSSELSSQIPFQLIRDRIKESAFSKTLVQHFESKAPNSRIYYGVMDADCIALGGLLERVDKTIEENHFPSLVSHGYRVSEEELPLIRIGVELDMKVRRAMNEVIPYSPYFPEPASFLCIREPHAASILSKLSFSGGSSQTLENRRLIQNARVKGLISQRAIFIDTGGVEMQTPERMKTQKSKNYPTLFKEQLKLKQNLQSLRGVSQSHAFPKNWADNLYLALAKKVRRASDATGPMMHMLGVYDPIARMCASESRYSSKIFDDVLKNYSNPLSSVQKEILQRARLALKELKYPVNEIDLIQKAAEESGLAIYNFLKERTGS